MGKITLHILSMGGPGGQGSPCHLVAHNSFLPLPRDTGPTSHGRQTGGQVQQQGGGCFGREQNCCGAERPPRQFPAPAIRAIDEPQRVGGVPWGLTRCLLCRTLGEQEGPGASRIGLECREVNYSRAVERTEGLGGNSVNTQQVAPHMALACLSAR